MTELDEIQKIIKMIENYSQKIYNGDIQFSEKTGVLGVLWFGDYLGLNTDYCKNCDLKDSPFLTNNCLICGSQILK